MDQQINLVVTGLPAFSDNYLWLLQRGSEAAIVDPGDGSVVERALVERGLRLTAILLTHHHADHTGGAAMLAARHRCPVYGPAGEAIPATTVRLSDGDSFEAVGVRFTTMNVPGHTLGHVAYAASTPAMVFCGDTLFAAGCGKLFEGTPAQMWQSLRRLAGLPDETQVYCGHEYTISNIRFARLADPGNLALADRQQEAAALRSRDLPTLPSTIGLERLTNPFLRADEPVIIERAASMADSPAVKAQLASQNGGPVNRGAIHTLAVLRAWKNTV
ncbi:hydroxyacylglutathione hydrolase [soil metagenome]